MEKIELFIVTLTCRLIATGTAKEKGKEMNKDLETAYSMHLVNYYNANLAINFSITPSPQKLSLKYIVYRLKNCLLSTQHQHWELFYIV